MKVETPTLEFLINSWEQDSKIDPTDISAEIVKIPLLHSKYLRYLTQHNLAVKRVNLEIDRIRKIKLEYYSGKMDKEELKKHGLEPFPFVLKSDISAYIDADVDMARLKKKRSYNEEAAAFCTSVLKELNNRTWQLRDFVSWKRFQHGL
jgi:Recombination, repair and ssDNA binding protein UvsY